MKEELRFNLLDLGLIIIILSIILAFTLNFKITREYSEMKAAIVDIQNYTSAIKGFKRKYGYLPGDIKKTQIFELSQNDTDGNQNGLIEDLNQQNGISGENIRMDGEVLNFWLHLYNSKFLKESKNVFPYINFLKTSIVIFTDEENNYYHLGVNGVNKIKEIETVNNLTPNQAYLIDRKLDDELPISGNIFVYSGNRLNISGFRKYNKNCATSNEYLTAEKRKLCQLVMKVNI